MSDAKNQKSADEAASSTVSPAARGPWLGLVAGLACGILLLTVSIALIVHFLQGRSTDLRAPTSALGSNLEHTLMNQGIARESIRFIPGELRMDHNALFYHSRLEVDVPVSLNPEGLESVIERSLWRDNIVVSAVEQHAGSRVLHLSLGQAYVGVVVLHGASENGATVHVDVSHSSAVMQGHLPETMASIPRPQQQLKEWTPPLLTLPQDPADSTQVARQSPRVAIIVDDGGYGGEQAEIILELDRRLTLSILPYTPDGKNLAERAAARGFEIMLHMPMENLDDSLRHEGQLDVGMSREEMSRLTTAALAQVPHAIGVNNHTGSKFTADAASVRSFLNWVDGSGLYFVDSGTTAHSVAYDSARELGIPSAARTLFLDNSDDPVEIRDRFLELVSEALHQGEAVGICHFRPATAKVLAEMVPQLASMGIELVPMSQLVR
jgi:polysaccharide deacetylase 2 family uncharacterized protein YibQ